MTRTFTELTLDDLLADPLVQMVMQSDGLSRGFVRKLMETARAALNRPPKQTPEAALRPSAHPTWPPEDNRRR